MDEKTMIEYEIYVPTALDNDAPFPHEKVAALRSRLVEDFGGLTDTRHRNEGLWRVGSHTVRDEIVIWKILSDKGASGDRLLKKAKKDLETILGQETLLVTRKVVGVLA